MGGAIMSFGPRTYATVLFLVGFVAITLVILVSREDYSNNKNTSVAVGAVPADCVNVRKLTRPLSETVTVQGEDGMVAIHALVFEICVAPGFTPDPKLIDTIIDVAREVVYQTYNKDAKASSENRILTTAFNVKLVAAEAAKRQLDQYVDYKGRIFVYVGTLPHTSEVFLTNTGRE